MMPQILERKSTLHLVITREKEYFHFEFLKLEKLLQFLDEDGFSTPRSRLFEKETYFASAKIKSVLGITDGRSLENR